MGYIATGPDNLPIAVLEEFGKKWGEFLNKITDDEMPDIWRKSILIPIFKNKEDTTNCGNCRDIKLMCHCMKHYERVQIIDSGTS